MNDHTYSLAVENRIWEHRPQLLDQETAYAFWWGPSVHYLAESHQVLNIVVGESKYFEFNVSDLIVYL